MKAIVVFSKRNVIGSKILQWAEKIPFSHVSIAIEIDTCRKEVYESVWPKSRMIDFKEWLTHYEVVEQYEFPIEDFGQLYAMKFFLKSKLRKWYSLGQILIMGIGFLSTPLNKWLSSKRWNGSRALVCTELVGDFMQKFYGATFPETTDTISLSETKAEVLKVKERYANISKT